LFFFTNSRNDDGLPVSGGSQGVRIDSATGAATPVGDTGYSITGLTSTPYLRHPVGGIVVPIDKYGTASAMDGSGSAVGARGIGASGGKEARSLNPHPQDR
jgi:hypothetical protein